MDECGLEKLTKHEQNIHFLSANGHLPRQLYGRADTTTQTNGLLMNVNQHNWFGQF